MAALTCKLKFPAAIVCDGAMVSTSWHPTGDDIYIKYISIALHGKNEPSDKFGFVYVQKNKNPQTEDCIGFTPLYLGRAGQPFVQKELNGDSFLLAHDETMLIEVYADAGAPWAGQQPVIEMGWTTSP